MLSPAKMKYRKMHKGRSKGIAYRGSTVAFGEWGLQVMEPGRITQRQLEAARIAMTRFIKRGGRIWIRIFPDKPITRKPQEVRMGTGKGAVEYWVCPVKPGRMLYEMAGVTEEVAKEAFRLASHKLPLHTRVIKRQD